MQPIAYKHLHDGDMHGFTLIEMVMTIVVLGIVAAMMAVFLQAPMQSYQDTVLRGQLTDEADTALLHIARDLKNALPNSIRITSSGGNEYLEYLYVRTAGTYRNQPSSGATACPLGGGGAGMNDTLELGFSDTCFLTVGSIPDRAQIITGDSLVIYNLGYGNTGADAYVGANRTTITSVSTTATSGEDQVNFSTITFPLDSASGRFFIVSEPVTYACNPTAKTLTRISGYSISATQATPPAGGTSAVLSNNVSRCGFIYDANVVAQRTSVVSIYLQLSKSLPNHLSSATVNLMQQVHVNNVP